MKALVCKKTGPRLLALCTAVIFLFSTSVPQLPAQSAVKAAAPISVEAQIKSIGIGHKALITRVDGSQLKGKIIAINPDSFRLNQGKHKGESSLAFSDVSAAKKVGLSKGAKIGIGIGIGIAGVAAAAGIIAAQAESSFPKYIPI